MRVKGHLGSLFLWFKRFLLLSLVGGDIAFGLLDANLIAVLYMVANPTSYILRGWIDIQYLIDILVVKSLLYDSLDMREVRHHTIFVQLF
jgi:hypothetical protein